MHPDPATLLICAYTFGGACTVLLWLAQQRWRWWLLVALPVWPVLLVIYVHTYGLPPDA